MPLNEDRLFAARQQERRILHEAEAVDLVRVPVQRLNDKVILAFTSVGVKYVVDFAVFVTHCNG